MSSEIQRYENDLKRKVQQALNNYPELVRQIRIVSDCGDLFVRSSRDGTSSGAE